MRLIRSALKAALAAGMALASTGAWADAAAPSFTLLAHFGRYPASISFDDTAYQTVGLIYSADAAPNPKPDVAAYAAGVLLSGCHVITSAEALSGVVKVGFDGTSGPRLRFALNPRVESGGSAQSWGMRVVSSRPQVAPTPRWVVLRLLDCVEAGPNTIANALDAAVALPAREEKSGLQRSRQVGILLQTGGEFLPVMVGGAYQQFDVLSQQWVTTGLAVAAAPERVGTPAGEMAPQTSRLLAGWDDGISAFPQPGRHVEQLEDVADSIQSAIEQDLAQKHDRKLGQPAPIAIIRGSGI